MLLRMCQLILCCSTREWRKSDHAPENTAAVRPVNKSNTTTEVCIRTHSRHQGYETLFFEIKYLICEPPWKSHRQLQL